MTENLTEPLTDQQIADMQARHEAARLGPWYREPSNVLGEFGVVNCHGELLGAIELAPDELSFVLAARMDMPALLADNARLRADLVSYQAESAQYDRDHERLSAELTEARTERDRYRDQVHAVQMMRCWVNEDGKKFVFAETLRAALGLTATGATPACSCAAEPVHQAGCDATGEQQ